jgi:hypothetical protein
LVLLQFRLWAVIGVVIGIIIIDAVLKRLVRGARPRNPSTNGRAKPRQYTLAASPGC